MTTIAAHIVLTSARMGPPEILIMQHEEGGAATRIDGIAIATQYHDDLDGAVSVLPLRGWRPTGGLVQVAEGYWTVDVERD